MERPGPGAASDRGCRGGGRLSFLFAADRCGKPVPTFPGTRFQPGLPSRKWAVIAPAPRFAAAAGGPDAREPAKTGGGTLGALRLSVRTQDFQSCKRGSTPLGRTNEIKDL